MPKGKNKPSIQVQYSKQRRRVLQFINRAKKKGYSFPEDIIPKIVKNPTRADVKDLSKLTPEKLYSQSKYGDISGEEQRAIEKEKAKIQAVINLSHAQGKVRAKKDIENQYSEDIRTPENAYKQREYRKQALLDLNNKFIDEDFDKVREFRSKLSESDRQLLNEALDEQGIETKQADAQNVTQQIPDIDEIEKTKQRKKFEEWRKKFKESMKQPKKERKWVDDGKAIYAGILERISQFENLYVIDTKFNQSHHENSKYKNMLLGALNMAIKQDGFNEVMRRLANKAQDIDNYITHVLFSESKQSAIEPNFQALIQIIKGNALTMQESQELEQYNIDHEYFPENGEIDNDLEE